MQVRLEPLVRVLGVAAGHGAGDRRTADAVHAVDWARLGSTLDERGWCHRLDLIEPETAATVDASPDGRRRQVVDVARRLALATEAAARRSEPVLVIGGDHSIAMGTWSGIANGLAPAGGLGLLWIDAHLDAHTPQTTPSGNWHGMPLAHLLGEGDSDLVGLARTPPALLGRHVLHVGARSFEPAEPVRLARHGVRTVAGAMLGADMLGQALATLRTIAEAAPAGFGVSIDLDCLDPEEAPGVGSPVVGGLGADALVTALAGLAHRPGFRGLEIAELNPHRDREGRTVAIVHRLIEAAFGRPAPTVGDLRTA